MDYCLTRAGYAARPVNVGMIGQAVCRMKDRVGELLCGRWPAFGDTADDFTLLWRASGRQSSVSVTVCYACR